MDRSEMNLRMEALKAAMHQHDYEKAVEIADELDLRKIRDNYFLSLVADAYEMCHEYDSAKDALLTAYENTNAGRQLAYRLCLISIKTKEYDEAEEFYEDFVEMAPRDTGRYILKYKMSKAQGASTEKLIEILEEYVNLDMDEKWAYELAKLYHLAGDQEKCVDMCDEISLWFAEGKYVLKALELKKKYRPLSALQQQSYKERKEKNIEEASKAEIEKIAENQKDAETDNTEENQKEAEIENTGTNPNETVAETPKRDDTMDIEEIVAQGMEEIDELDEELFDHKDTSVTEKIVIQSQSGLSSEDAKDQAENINKLSDVPAKEVNMDKPSNVSVEEKNTEESLDVPAEEKNMDGPSDVPVEENNEDKPSDTPAKENNGDKPSDVPAKDSNVEEPVKEINEVKNLDDVQAILKQLEKRGILKTETVSQAVTIIEEAGNEENIELDYELAKIDEESEREEKERQRQKEREQNFDNSDEFMEDIDELPNQEPIEEEFDDIEEYMEDESEDTSDNNVGKTKNIPNLEAIKKEMEKQERQGEPEQEEDIIERDTSDNEMPDEKNIPVLDLNFETEDDAISDETQAGEENDVVSAETQSNEENDAISDETQSDEKNDVESDETQSDKENDVMPDEIQADEEKNVESDMTQTDGDIPPDNYQNDRESDVISTGDFSVEVEVLAGGKTDEENEETEKGNNDKITEPESEIKNDDTVESEQKDDSVESEQEDEKDNVSGDVEGVRETKMRKSKEVKQKEEKIEQTEKKKVVLSDDELEVFKNYLNVEGLESNIRETIEDLIANYTPDGKSQDGNVIILGDKKTGKTTLAIEMIKLVNRKRGRRNRKLAKVQADALNRRGFRNSLMKLVGSDLIVEDAHELEEKRIREIIYACSMFTDDMLIILEGDTKEMKEIMENVSHIKEVFDHVIEIKEYDIREWVEYGREYAKENGCVMDELASLAFYKAIDDCFGEKKGISREDVEGILDDAMEKCKKKRFGVKKDDEDNIILSEKNFR